MIFHCPHCNEGPYRSERGIQQHVARHCTVFAARFGGVARQKPIAEAPPPHPPMPSVAAAVEVPPVPRSPGNWWLEQMDGSDSEPQEAKAQDDFPGDSPGGSGTHDRLHSPEVPSQHVLEPDSTELPSAVKAAMFQKPTNFGPGYLRDNIDTEGHVFFRRNMWGSMTPDLKSGLHLLKILKGENLSLFDEIQKWRLTSYHVYEDRMPSIHSYLSRKQAMGRLQKLYGYDSLNPTVKSVTLPSTGVECDLIVFSFGCMLQSLLCDPEAVQRENLSFEPECLDVPPLEEDCYDDFNSGTVHLEARNRYCREHDDLLSEIAMFIDKTHLDGVGKHTLEPIMFTLGIFKRSFRNRDTAWRPLGYIPNLDLLAPNRTADEKQQDYHYCLRILFSELVAFQGLQGIEWKFAFDKLEVSCRLQIPVNCILGDTDGHDKLCARKVDRTGTNDSKLCRSCNVGFSNLGMPLSKEKVKVTTCPEIRWLRNNLTEGNRKKLQVLGYRDFHDGCVDLHFCDPERALHGATPGEVLHAFQLGLAERAIESCFGARKSKKKAKPPRKNAARVVVENSDDNASTGSERTEESRKEADVRDGSVMTSVQMNRKAHKVFGKKALERVDKLAKQLHSYLRWQSDKSMPRTSFSRGITKLPKLQAHERSGVLLILMVIMVLDHWAYWRLSEKEQKRTLLPDKAGYLEQALTRERAANMVKSIYLLLTYEAFMRSDRIPKSTTKRLEEFIPIFLDQVLRTFNREEGAGNNLIKNHLPFHLIEDIRRLGSPQNFNSGIGESLHKTSAKETGRRTNMNAQTFEQQTGRRYVENPTWRIYRGQPEANDRLDTKIISVGRDFIEDRKGRRMNTIPVWRNGCLSSESLVRLVREQILPNLPSVSSVNIHGRLLCRNGQSYSANPCYGSGGEAKQHWAYVKYEDYGLVPSHLLCVIEIEDKPTTDIEWNGSVVDERGYYFVVNSALSSPTCTGDPGYVGTHNDEGTLAHVDQKIMHRIPKAHREGNGNWVKANNSQPPTLLLVDSKSVHGPCIAFPDILCRESQYDYYFIAPWNTWGGLFIQEAIENHARKGRKRGRS
jgi:hypothetical protein